HTLGAGDLAALAEAFHREHEHTYGYAMREERVELVALKVRARGSRDNGAGRGGAHVDVPWDRLGLGRPVQRADRSVYFKAGRVSTPVIGRSDLGSGPSS